MTGNWEQNKQKSKYHFDNFKNDPQVDKIINLGKIVANYTEDVKHIIAKTNSAPSRLKMINELFSLENCTEKIYVQMPGDVCNLQLSNLAKLAPDSPWTIMYIQVELTDYEQGHFSSYGNYIHTQWRAGDVTTFDWQNLPYSTANAGHNPRVTLQLTGVVTEKTNDFLSRLKRFGSHQLELKNESWF
jgi:hypothetical protein